MSKPTDNEDDEEEFGDNDEFLDGMSLSDDDEAFLEGGDPIQKAKDLEAHAEKAMKFLLSEGYEQDELDTMFKTPKALIEFYMEKRRGAHTLDGELLRQEVDAEANEGPEPEDDFELDDAATQAYLPSPQKGSKSTPPPPPPPEKGKKATKPKKKK